MTLVESAESFSDAAMRRSKVKKVSLNFSLLSPIVEGAEKLSKNDEIC